MVCNFDPYLNHTYKGTKMTDKKLYELLQKEWGSITELRRRSGISFLHLRNIMRDGLWVNLTVREHAITILEERKRAKEEQNVRVQNLEQRAARLMAENA